MAMIAAEKSNLNFKQIINVVKQSKTCKWKIRKNWKNKNKSLVILDYAHTPDALKTCLENLKEQFKR